MQPLRQSCREILLCTLMLLPESDEHQVTAFARTEVVLSTRCSRSSRVDLRLLSSDCRRLKIYCDLTP